MSAAYDMDVSQWSERIGVADQNRPITSPGARAGRNLVRRMRNWF